MRSCLEENSKNEIIGAFHIDTVSSLMQYINDDTVSFYFEGGLRHVQRIAAADGGKEGRNHASSLPSSGTDGQIFLVPI